MTPGPSFFAWFPACVALGVGAVLGAAGYGRLAGATLIPLEELDLEAVGLEADELDG